MYTLHGHLIKVIAVLEQEVRQIALVTYQDGGYYRETYLDMLVPMY